MACGVSQYYVVGYWLLVCQTTISIFSVQEVSFRGVPKATTKVDTYVPLQLNESYTETLFQQSRP